MARIPIKNGDWDAASAKLKADMDARQAQFDAKVGSALKQRKGQPEPKAKPAESFTIPAEQSILSRSRLRG